MKTSILAGALAIVLACGVAHAEPSDEAKARAREEFRRGLALEVAKDYEGALAAFKGVALVKSSPQVRFHIAVCEENVGNWMGALGSYRLALAEAREGKVTDVQQEAEAALAALEPRIPKITLVRGTGAAGALVVLDGRELGPASIGGEIPVNPGPHQVEATAPGYEPTRLTITVKEGEAQEVGITLQPIKVTAGAPGPKVDVVAPGSSALLPVGITFASLGAASLIVSGVFFGLKQSAISDLDAACGADGQSCPADLLETRDNGELYSTLSLGTFIGGLGAVALGGTLIIVELATKPGSSAKQGAQPTVRASVSPTGISLKGQF